MLLSALLAPISLVAPADRAAPAHAAGEPITSVVIFTPGIDPMQGSTPYDPYTRADDSFSSAGLGQPSIMDDLSCQANPPSGSAFAPCAPGIAWVPYSYNGVSSETINTYTGADTGQALSTSVTAMQSIIDFVRKSPEAKDAKLYVVAHSLGGAVATDWLATNHTSDVTIVTLDSPVNGIWPADKTVLKVYCNNSVGLLSDQTQQATCELLPLLPALTAPVIADLENPAIISQMGSANPVSFANTADIFVPSWFSINPQSTGPHILMTSVCNLKEDPYQLRHECILIAAASEVTAFVQTGRTPPPTPINLQLSLNITVRDGYPPSDAPVTLAHAGQVFETVTPQDGKVTAKVPWEDVLVQTNYQGSILAAAALPDSDEDLSLALGAPTKTCAPTHPAPGDTSVCKLTLAAAVPDSGTVTDTIEGVTGASITNCEAATGGLSCGDPSGASVTLSCSGPTEVCPTGSTFTIGVTAKGAGTMTENVQVTPLLGGTPISFPVDPVPPVIFRAVP